MNAAIIEVTLRGVLGRRRTLLVALLAAVPILIAALIRVGGSTSNGATLTAGLLDALVVATVLPLVALVFGTAVLGSELDDGTAVYLLVKPLPRWQIVLSKLVVAIGVTIALVFPTALIAGLIAGGGRGGELIAVGYGLAVVAGSIVYVAAFVALSVMTGRALIAGLLYIFIWEGLIAGLFAGTALFSVRQYVLAFARWLAGSEGSSIHSTVEPSTALAMSVLVLVVAVLLAARRLAVWEVRTAE
jgi:ABC-2 type transport system permease protein